MGLFNSSMTLEDANEKFFNAIIAENTVEGRNNIFEEYRKVTTEITKKDLSENDGILTSYTFPK